MGPQMVSFSNGSENCIMLFNPSPIFRRMVEGSVAPTSCRASQFPNHLHTQRWQFFSSDRAHLDKRTDVVLPFPGRWVGGLRDTNPPFPPTPWAAMGGKGQAPIYVTRLSPF